MNIDVISPGGRQIHATQHGEGEWKNSTYLYEDDLIYEGDEVSFYFEQHRRSGRGRVHIRKGELKEHVAKLLPLLFTPEELKKLSQLPRGRGL